MRLLVTGAGGFVGRHLVFHLLEIGDEVAGLVRRETSLPCPTIIADLLDQTATASALRAFQPDAIIHLAGYADAGRSYTEPTEAWRGNLDATLNLYRDIGDWGGSARILFVSSGAVYGPGSTDEDSALRPINPYAASKAAADLASYQAFAQTGMGIVRVRPFNQIGPGQSAQYAVSTFAQQIARIKAGRQAPIIETGQLNFSRDLTDVRDMVVAYRLLVEKGRPGEVYNAASGTSVIMREVLEQMVRIAGIKAAIRTAADRVRPGDANHVRISSAKLRSETGWEPRLSLERSLQDILSYWDEEISKEPGITK